MPSLVFQEEWRRRRLKRRTNNMLVEKKNVSIRGATPENSMKTFCVTPGA